MNEIGGYFELDLNDFGSLYHDDLVALNTGRNALEFILIQQGYEKIYIPYYTCDVTLQPIKRQNIDYEFYFLDKDFYPKNVVLKDKEAILYVNYFGIMNNQVKRLSEKYSNLIVDNSQAFYENPLDNVDTFYSPRKFFGLPDGGFASCYTRQEMKLDRDNSYERMSHLLIRIDKGAESGYEQFKANDKKLDNLSIKKMSRLTDHLMRNISFETIKKRRKHNFLQMHEYLHTQNELTTVIENSDYKAPMIYPYLKEGNQELRKKLIENKIYTAIYWPNVLEWVDKDSVEFMMTRKMLPLPIDQRYKSYELKIIVKLINRI